MIELLPNGPLLAGFLAATFVLAVTPGPGVLYIVARTLAQGRGAGLASVAGVALGNLGNAVGASLGLAALFALSSSVFLVVKVAGAAYLIHLGIQALRQPAALMAAESPAAAERRRIFRDGFFVALLNPKTTLFFAAFLPQFIDSTRSPAGQSLVLSASFVLVAAATDGAYVLMASTLAPALHRRPALAARGRLLSAAVYVGLGLYALLTPGQPTRKPTP